MSKRRKSPNRPFIRHHTTSGRLVIEIYPPLVPYAFRRARTELHELADNLEHLVDDDLKRSSGWVSENDFSLICKILRRVADDAKLCRLVFREKVSRGRLNIWPDRDYLVCLAYWAFYYLHGAQRSSSKFAESKAAELAKMSVGNVRKIRKAHVIAESNVKHLLSRSARLYPRARVLAALLQDIASRLSNLWTSHSFPPKNI